MANTAPNALIDSHCHLDLDAFDSDRDAVMQAAQAAGVMRMHIPGTIASRWDALLAAAQQPEIDISLGLHPYFLDSISQQDLATQLQRLDALLSEHTQSISAVGECGLDAVIVVDIARQLAVFERHVQLAQNHQKPLIVHARKTHHLIHQRLSESRFVGRGIIHAFSGSIDLAKQYVERGFLLGIGGTITYPRAQKTRDAIRQIGLDAIVLETDSPDMPLCGFQGQRNTPAQVVKVARTVSELLEEDFTTVCQKTSNNYLALFA
ncbi:TatD family hydrolase [Alteromonas facilis]|uniref:TatD family hydrolase n=1 Tax=Alteromonas facilis TaxID=2048004 RepID=UPI000C28B1E5|nr:TatD family hydrolase [Alteromonas facilis]